MSEIDPRMLPWNCDEEARLQVTAWLRYFVGSRQIIALGPSDDRSVNIAECGRFVLAHGAQGFDIVVSEDGLPTVVRRIKKLAITLTKVVE